MTELVEQISNFNADHPLSLLFDRCRTLADRAGDGSLPFVEAIDMAYSAASWAGLVERYGDDVVQPPSRLPVYLRQKICIDFDDVTVRITAESVRWPHWSKHRNWLFHRSRRVSCR